jgi:hypothetical protein
MMTVDDAVDRVVAECHRPRPSRADHKSLWCMHFSTPWGYICHENALAASVWNAMKKGIFKVTLAQHALLDAIRKATKETP